MNINDIKMRVFAIDDLCHGTDIQQRQGKRLIKGLKQPQRDVLLKILQNSYANINKEELISLNNALKQERNRNKWIFSKISRGWKNAYSHRIKSSSIFGAIPNAKTHYKGELAKKAAEEKRNEENKAAYQRQLIEMAKPTSLKEIERRLDFFQSDVISMDALRCFLVNNAKTLSFFAFKHPKRWASFTKQMMTKIVVEFPATDENLKIKQLFIQLDRIHHPSAVGAQKFDKEESLPIEILHLIASKLPKDENSLRSLQLLYRDRQSQANSVLRSISPEGLAKWMIENKVSLTSLDLSQEDIKQVAKYLSEIDLFSIGGGKFSNKERREIKEFTYDGNKVRCFNNEWTKEFTILKESDFKYLGIFENVEIFYFFRFFPIGIEKYLNLDKLKHLSVVDCRIPDDGLSWALSQPLEWLALNAVRGLEKIDLSQFTKVKTLALENQDLLGLTFPPQLIGIILKNCTNISYEAIKKLKALTLENQDLLGQTFPPQLIRLRLENCTNVSYEAIKKLANLRQLSITKNEMTSENLKSIAELPLLIDFECQDIPNEGIKLLTNMRYLYLNGVVSKESLEAINKLTELRFLEFADRHLSDDELMSLTNLPNIEAIIHKSGFWKRP